MEKPIFEDNLYRVYGFSEGQCRWEFNNEVEAWRFYIKHSSTKLTHCPLCNGILTK